MKTFQFDNLKPILSWCETPEEGCIEQAKNLASLPFVVERVALMPDCHQGYGMPIGGVIACKDVIIPNAVGVDIGCGMMAVHTSLKNLEINKLKGIMGKIRDAIPVGFHHHKKPQEGIPLRASERIVSQEYESATHQLGTLGGGNHFIEIQQAVNGDDIWIMLHSGSRNIGLKVAKYYNDLAKELNQQWHTGDPKADLAFLPIESEEGKAYLDEMNYCLSFAQANRSAMMKRIKDFFFETTGCDFLQEVNIHHNYARMENHHGRNVMIHRKGATSAREGEIGIIPGSQGTFSYIVRGKGNKASFTSCSHGAGRKLGRKEACRTLNLEKEKKFLDDQGILHSIRGEDDLEEAPSAYKSIDVVMEEQKDLVDAITKLKPLGVIKG